MTDPDTNDVEFEHEDAPENQAHEKLVAKIEKLKTELEKTKAEKQEYLDGWQRMRADVANMKRDQAGYTERTQNAVKEEIIGDIIPILDSFDMAMQGEKWNAVDEAWRKGVEYIRAQCVSVLEKHGITAFGAVGEVFDANLHESVQEAEDDSVPSHSIVRVLRRGYRMNGRIIRPAQVIISK
ncbi:nucleotide exchange factor GrpE [Candidatus Kaiserbacteria bacterium]|nr:nucleotide exchange factor GrpE [Candidatus Kaiserbacteria bacterium]